MDCEILEFAAEHNAVVTLVGGTDPTLGIVELGGAGGRGYLTGSYGMGSDNFLQATVVTPQSDIIASNGHESSRIFWAIRGGGGGTSGVLKSLIVKPYPILTAVMWPLNASLHDATDISGWYKIMGGYFAKLPSLEDAGLQGYITLNRGSPSLINAMIAYDQFKEDVEEAVSSMLEYPNTKKSSMKIDSSMSAFPRWVDVSICSISLSLLLVALEAPLHVGSCPPMR